MKAESKHSLTMKDLDKEIKRQMQRNPNLNSEKYLELSVDNLGGDDVDEFLHIAAVNQISLMRTEGVRKAAANSEEWIDATVQGDVFNGDIEVRTPKWIEVEGEEKPYYECTQDQIISYLQTMICRDEAEITNIDIQISNYDKKRKEIVLRRDKKKADIQQLLRVKEIAKERGLNPDEIRLSQKEKA